MTCKQVPGTTNGLTFLWYKERTENTKKFMGGYTHRQQSDLISLILFSQNNANRLKMVLGKTMVAIDLRVTLHYEAVPGQTCVKKLVMMAPTPTPKPSSFYFSLIYIRLKYTETSRPLRHTCGDRNHTAGITAIIQDVPLFSFRGGERCYLGSKSFPDELTNDQLFYTGPYYVGEAAAR
jgi:hypothetical protein